MFQFDRPASEANLVRIYLLLTRIPAKSVDLVLVVNAPLPPPAPSSEAAADLLTRTADRIFQEAKDTLRIRDFGLFA